MPWKLRSERRQTARPAREAVTRAQARELGSCGKDAEQDVGNKKVDEDDEHRGGDHGLNCGAAHALGSPGGSHSVEAADGAENEAKEEGLDHALNNVGVAEVFIGLVKVLGA